MRSAYQDIYMIKGRIMSFILITLITVPNLINAQWIEAGGPYGGHVLDLCISGSTMLAGTNDGVAYSLDLGKHWRIYRVYDNPVKRVCIDSTGFYAINDFYIFHSPDFGLTWKFKDANSVGIRGHLSSISICNKNILVGADNQSGCFIAPGFDSAFHQVSEIGSRDVMALATRDSKSFAGSYQGKLYLSENCGADWAEIADLKAPIDRILCGDSSVYVSAHDSGLHSFTRQGPNWIYSKLKTPFRFLRSMAANRKYVYIYIYDGVYRSPDNGASWEKVIINTPTNVGVICVAANDAVLAIGTVSDGVFISTDEGASWQQASAGLAIMAVNTLERVGDTLLACTNYGVFMSEDQGDTWRQIENGGGEYVLSYANNNVFVTMSEPYKSLYLYRDSLSSPMRITPPAKRQINCLFYYDSLLFLGTDSGFRYRTLLDTHWIPNYPVGAKVAIGAMAALGTLIYAGNKKGDLYTSSDGGLTWIYLSTISTDAICSIIPTDKAVFVGTDKGLYSSSDNGRTWQLKVYDNSIFTPRNLAQDGSNMAVFASGHYVFFSQDSGVTWENITRPDSVGTLMQSVALDEKYLYQGTKYHGLFRRLLTDLVPAENHGKIIRSAQELSTCPNPFNPTVAIRYTAADGITGELSIYNPSGQIVFSKPTVGKGCFVWNAAGQPSGLYFFMMKIEGRTLVKKVALVR